MEPCYQIEPLLWRTQVEVGGLRSGQGHASGHCAMPGALRMACRKHGLGTVVSSHLTVVSPRSQSIQPHVLWHVC